MSEVKKLSQNLDLLHEAGAGRLKIPIARIIGLLPPEEYVTIEELCKEVNALIGVFGGDNQ